MHALGMGGVRKCQSVKSIHKLFGGKFQVWKTVTGGGVHFGLKSAEARGVIHLLRGSNIDCLADIR